MTDDLKSAVKKLKSLSPQLNKATDEANRIIAEVEKFLNEECSIGIPAQVAIDWEQPSPKKTTYKNLAYARIDGKFRLCIQWVSVTEFTTQNNLVDEARKVEAETPLASCPRGERLAAFAELPNLLVAIAEAAESSIASATNSSKTVTEILSALKS